jgi:hypothetical protein
MGDAAAAGREHARGFAAQPPSARVIARLMTSQWARLSAAEANRVTTLRNKVPALHVACVSAWRAD